MLRLEEVRWDFVQHRGKWEDHIKTWWGYAAVGLPSACRTLKANTSKKGDTFTVLKISIYSEETSDIVSWDHISGRANLSDGLLQSTNSGNNLSTKPWVKTNFCCIVKNNTKFAMFELKLFFYWAGEGEFPEKTVSMLTADTRKGHFIERRGCQLLLIVWSQSQSSGLPPAWGGLFVWAQWETDLIGLT